MCYPGNVRAWLILAFCLLPLAALGKVCESSELAAAMQRLGLVSKISFVKSSSCFIFVQAKASID